MAKTQSKKTTKPRLRGPDGRFLPKSKQDPAPGVSAEVIDGDTYMDSQGRLLYSAENSLGKKPHSLAKQPTELAFSPEGAKDANRIRWDERRLAADQGLIEAAGGDVTATEAYQRVVEAQGKQALDGKTAAAKFVAQVTDSLPRSQTGQPNIQAQTLNIIQMNFRSLDDLQGYIEQQREAGRVTNASFIEAQMKELEPDDPIEIDVLIGDKK